MVNTILDDEYSQYFGFTEEEVSAMAQYYGVSDRLGEIKEWYDGYMFGRTEYIIRGRLLITSITNVFPKLSGQEQVAMR